MLDFKLMDRDKVSDIDDRVAMESSISCTNITEALEVRHKIFMVKYFNSDVMDIVGNLVWELKNV